jgi:hypothetical protein
MVLLVLIIQFTNCSFKRAGKKVLVFVPEKEYIVPRNKIENGDMLEGARESYQIKLLNDGKKPASGGSQTGKLGDIWISDMPRAQCELVLTFHNDNDLQMVRRWSVDGLQMSLVMSET